MRREIDECPHCREMATGWTWGPRDDTPMRMVCRNGHTWTEDHDEEEEDSES